MSSQPPSAHLGLASEQSQIGIKPGCPGDAYYCLGTAEVHDKWGLGAMAMRIIALMTGQAHAHKGYENYSNQLAQEE